MAGTRLDSRATLPSSALISNLMGIRHPAPPLLIGGTGRRQHSPLCCVAPPSDAKRTTYEVRPYPSPGASNTSSQRQSSTSMEALASPISATGELQLYGGESSITLEQTAATVAPFALVSSLASSLCNMAERAVNELEVSVQPIRPRASDPAIHLAGGFVPLMEESPPQPCPHVEGTIPPCLNGVYVRNGPNPQRTPEGGYHHFDGDGMIHAVLIKNGQASHACRFTQTNRYLSERRAGQPLFINAVGELNGLFGLAKLSLLNLRHGLGILDRDQGIGSANAGLAFFNGKLLAMSEDDIPYHVKVTNDGDLVTVGRYDFGGELTTTMTAHPKVDPTTGEMFSFNYNLLLPPYLNYFRVSPEGKKHENVPITLTEPTLIHDFAVTENYAVFCEHQMVFRLQDMFAGKSPIGCDSKKVPRVGVLRKYDSSEVNMVWFDCPGATCFHFLNAWEEGDEVVMVGSVNQPVEVIFEHPERLKCRLTEFRFNVRSGECTSEQICSADIDVGRINEKYMGKKNRYAYLCVYGPWPNFSGVAKVDLQARRLGAMATSSEPGSHTGEPCIVGWRKFGEGYYSSEPFFVPARDDTEEEDDGFVLTFVQDVLNSRSDLVIMDAKSSTLAIVASIRIPTRVPNGFHGLFIHDQQLGQQV